MGFEHTTDSHIPTEKSHISPSCAAKCAALKPAAQHLDADLASIIEAWPGLADEVRRTIAGVVRLSIRKP